MFIFIRCLKKKNKIKIQSAIAQQQQSKQSYGLINSFATIKDYKAFTKYFQIEEAK